MKKLGLIGGVGPESTIPYYRGIIYGVQKELNNPFFPPLVIESLSSFEVIRMSSQKDREGLTKYFTERHPKSCGGRSGSWSVSLQYWTHGFQRIAKTIAYSACKHC